MTRARPATGLAVIGIVVIGLLVALPAYRASNTRAQGEDLANKVLSVCAQGGDAAAPLVALHACPLAKQVASSSPTPEAVAPPAVVPAQVPVIRQFPGPVLPPLGNGGGPRSTEEAAPPHRIPLQFRYPASDRREERRPPERTVTEAAPPSTVTETVQAPAPAVEQRGAPLLTAVGGLLNSL